MSASLPFLSRIGIRLPIIQAPMAGVSTPLLAAAVSNAGGLGSIGIGASSVAQARKDIESVRCLTDRPFNVNVFCHEPARRDAQKESQWIEFLAPFFTEFEAECPSHLEEIYESFLSSEAAFEMLLELRPNVVSFHFGVPDAQKIAALRDVGVYTMATATCLAEARLIEAAGVDALVAQGVEAGGHRGIFDADGIDEKLSTHVLVNILARESPLPVIAAGGIMNGAGIRSVLDLGADAAQLGTAFLLCPESAANESYRENLRKSSPAAFTCLTKGLSGRPARGLVNEFIQCCEAQDAPSPAAYPLAYDAAKQLNAAAGKKGSAQFAAHWAGQGVPLARELPAHLLVKALEKEFLVY